MFALTIVALFAFIFFGFVGGFRPIEHRIIIRNAKRYVMEAYGLTPTNVRVTTLYLWFPVTVSVETEENDFWFTLRTGRFFYGVRHFNDDYLARMTEHILARDLRAYVEEITNGQGTAIVLLYIGGSQILNYFTLPELKANPSVALENLQSYGVLVILYDDITERGYKIDYGLIYKVYSRMLEIGLNPRHSVTFIYSAEDGMRETLLRVDINRRYFPEINSADDLKPFFEEAIQRRLTLECVSE